MTVAVTLINAATAVEVMKEMTGVEFINSPARSQTRTGESDFLIALIGAAAVVGAAGVGAVGAVAATAVGKVADLILRVVEVEYEQRRLESEKKLLSAPPPGWADITVEGEQGEQHFRVRLGQDGSELKAIMEQHGNINKVLVRFPPSAR